MPEIVYIYGNKATFETTWNTLFKWETAELDYFQHRMIELSNSE